MIKDDRYENTWSNRDYPVKEDMAFQRFQWRFERSSWFILFLIIFLALLGLFSGGPLSSKKVADSSAQMQMDFQRFHRNGALTDMVLILNSSGLNTATIRFNTHFVEAFSIEDIQPDPVLSLSSSDGISFTFGASKQGRMPVYLSVRPRHPGVVSGRVRLNNNEPISFPLFIYP